MSGGPKTERGHQEATMARGLPAPPGRHKFTTRPWRGEIGAAKTADIKRAASDLPLAHRRIPLGH
jgi:hypothetical protein